MKVCIGCQDFESNVGHEAIWCPNIVCQKCQQKGHTKITCMSGHEDLKTLPNEILVKIISYVSDDANFSYVSDDANLKFKYPSIFDDLHEFAKVSKRFQEICETQKKIVIDKTLKIQEVTDESLPMLISAWRISYPNTEKVKAHARNVLFADPHVTYESLRFREKTLKQFSQNKLLRKQQEEKDKVI